MQVRTSIVSVFVVGAAVILGLAGMAAPTSLMLAQRSPGSVPVDVELVIAVDVSSSMDPDEQALQREGYIAGLTSPEFISAVREGIVGKVAITYFEWAGLYDQKIIVPWRVIEDAATADAVANEITSAPYRRASRTSIYGALQFAKPLFDASGYAGLRRVIDVSGDGVNNMGPAVTHMRDLVVAAGITINGLPIMLKRGSRYSADANLDLYYQDCVIGGPGAFMIAIHERDQFREATRTKLILEIADRAPKPRVVPVQARAPRCS